MKSKRNLNQHDFYKKIAIRVIIYSWLFTGFAVWLGGRYAYHIGASGLIYAFASFLFFSGILSKDKNLSKFFN